MTSRERTLAAAMRRRPDRVPTFLWLTPHIEERLRTERGADDPQAYLGMDIRMVDYRAQPERNDFSAYTTEFPPDAAVDEWGCGAYPVGYFHFTKAVAPLKPDATITDAEQYPIPHRTPDIAALRAEVARIQGQGLAAFSQYECGTFEQGHALMGMEAILPAMYTQPEMVRVLFDRISDTKARMAAAYVEAGVDVLFIGDDIGMQNGPVMSEPLWRDLVLPPLRKIIAAARAVRDDIPIAYHSCGAVGWAVDGLIEAGITILQSLQPEANDLPALKRRHGDRLAFWGGIGSQSTMSHGSPEDVKAAVRDLMRTLGEGGGWICSPAHFIEPESPIENLDAFVEATRAFGVYR